MSKLKIYSSSQTKTELVLPKEYSQKPNLSLVAQAVHVLRSRSHLNLARVKTRSEVNLSKRKIYKQKGTGGARHGAKSAHIFVGGGVVHGPDGRKRQLDIPKKARQKALLHAISFVAKNGKAFAFDGGKKLTKTKEAQKLVDSIRKDMGANAKLTFVFAEANMENTKFYKNIANVELVSFSKLNARIVMHMPVLLLDKEIFAKAKKSTKSATLTK